MKKILFIAADFPSPPKGGGTRSFYFLKALAAENEITVFSLLGGNKKLLADKLNINPEMIFAFDKNINRKQNSVNKFLNKILITFLPETVSNYVLLTKIEQFIRNLQFDTVLKSKVKKLLLLRLKFAMRFKQKISKIYPAKTYERYLQFKHFEKSIEHFAQISDIIWVEFSYILPLTENIRKKYPQKKIICNTHNAEFTLEFQKAETEKNKYLKKWLLNQAEILKNDETKALSLCNKILVCSETDKQIFENYIKNTNIEIAPNGVDLDYFVAKTKNSGSKKILFTGNMDYLPNREAVFFFSNNVLPKLVNTDRNIKFVIAGNNAEKQFKNYSDNKNIEIINSPEDMRPVFEMCNIVVVPLFSGSGTRLKILEAFAMRKPVISTTKGAEGIKCENQKHILFAETEQDFIEKILLLQNDKTIADKLAENACNLVNKKYSWSTITSIIVNNI